MHYYQTGDYGFLTVRIKSKNLLQEPHKLLWFFVIYLHIIDEHILGKLFHINYTCPGGCFCCQFNIQRNLTDASGSSAPFLCIVNIKDISIFCPIKCKGVELTVIDIGSGIRHPFGLVTFAVTIPVQSAVSFSFLVFDRFYYIYFCIILP